MPDGIASVLDSFQACQATNPRRGISCAGGAKDRREAKHCLDT